MVAPSTVDPETVRGMTQYVRGTFSQRTALPTVERFSSPLSTPADATYVYDLALKVWEHTALQLIQIADNFMDAGAPEGPVIEKDREEFKASLDPLMECGQVILGILENNPQLSNHMGPRKLRGLLTELELAGHVFCATQDQHNHAMTALADL
jgi:hypothetical protein